MAITAMGLALTVSGSICRGEDIPPDLARIQAKTAPDVYTSKEFKDLRPEAIREAARTLALQAAVKWRYGQILEELQQNEASISSVFDFRSMLIHNGRVLPPVIVEGQKGLKLESDTVAQSVDVTYRILQPAKFVTAPPHWRDYLWQEFAAEEDVNPAVLPKDSGEREIWKKAAAEGWQKGIVQAEQVYQANLNRMARDFRGMLRFNLLLTQNIISMPLLAEGNLGVQVAGETLDVNQKVFRITMPSQWRRTDEWKPVVSQMNH